MEDGTVVAYNFIGDYRVLKIGIKIVERGCDYCQFGHMLSFLVGVRSCESNFTDLEFLERRIL